MRYNISIFWVGLMLVGACGSASAGEDSLRENHEVHPWCEAPAVEISEQLVLTSDSLGPVTAHVTRSELKQLCPTIADTTWFDAEGNVIEGSALVFFGKAVGLVEWSNGSLLRVLVTSPRVETEQGFRIGSTLGSIRQVTPDIRAAYDDAGVYVWSDTDSRISYLLDARAWELLPSPDDVAEQPEILPDSAVVKQIQFDGAG